MVDNAGDYEARGDRLLGFPLPSPRVRIRPWWFPAQELRNPLVFFLEAWLADLIFGPDRALVPEMEWMSQALLMVDAVDAGNLVEVTVFARPAVQRQVKSVLLSQASVHREQRARDPRFRASSPRNDTASTPLPPWRRSLKPSIFPYPAEKMEQLEEFLKAQAPGPQVPQHPVA
uniref:Oocyte expressed protein n=1 Tax=Bos taurus TaxID=9913 RepID=A0AAF6Z6F6_BOVIN